VGKHYELARGWERQLDQRYASLFYGTVVTPGRYRRYLLHNAVSYVAVQDGPTDFAASAENDLLQRGGLPYLRRLWANAHWTLYAVIRPTPLLSGPGRLVSTSPDSFTIDARRAGRFVMRLHFSPYWAVTTGTGCVSASRGNWTAVTVRQPGRAEVSMSFSPIRVVSQGRRCS
jgi:hypothetical protein